MRPTRAVRSLLELLSRTHQVAIIEGLLDKASILLARSATQGPRHHELNVIAKAFEFRDRTAMGGRSVSRPRGHSRRRLPCCGPIGTVLLALCHGVTIPPPGIFATLLRSVLTYRTSSQPPPSAPCLGRVPGRPRSRTRVPRGRPGTLSRCNEATRGLRADPAGPSYVLPALATWLPQSEGGKEGREPPPRHADNAHRLTRGRVYRVGRSIDRLVTHHGTRPSGRYRRGCDRLVLPWSALTSHAPAQGESRRALTAATGRSRPHGVFRLFLAARSVLRVDVRYGPYTGHGFSAIPQQCPVRSPVRGIVVGASSPSSPRTARPRACLPSLTVEPLHGARRRIPGRAAPCQQPSMHPVPLHPQGLRQPLRPARVALQLVAARAMFQEGAPVGAGSNTGETTVT